MKRLAGLLGLILTIVFSGALARGAKSNHILAAHPTHAQNDVPCETCHQASTSQAGSDNLLPAMETCGMCHAVGDDQQCGMCHANPAEPAAAPRLTGAVQKFPHAKHLKAGMECDACHGNTAQSEPHLPAKAICRSCHETASGRSDCALCHAAGEPLRPASHTPGWLAFHGSDARVDQARCADCHTQADCQECHSGDNVRPRSHPLNYAFSHALDARGNESACASCHEEAQFCQACHLAEHVMPENHSRADWLVRRGGGRHAEEGELDIESCTFCHDSGSAAPVCAECHGR